MATRARNGSRVSPRALERSVQSLRREVQILRGGLMSILGEDPEGDYHPKFVESVLRAARKQPTRVFRNARSFLAEVRKRG